MSDYHGFMIEAMDLCVEMLPRYIGEAHDRMDTKAKEDGTPVTSLDHYAMERLRTLILKHFPGHVTIGEEDKRNPEEMKWILAQSDEPQWSIDGLDGTWHFDAGTNSYGAMIALRQGPAVLLSMIFKPIDMALRRNGFFYAVRDGGAWEWCGCTNTKYTSRRLGTHLLHAQPLHAAPYNFRRLVVMLEGSSKNFWTTKIRHIGATITTRPSLSSCIAATTIARGNLEVRAMVTSGHKPWDSWPISLMLRESGCIVTDHEGAPYTAEQCANIAAATNPTDHAHLLRLLNPC